MREKLKNFIENKYVTGFILGVIIYNSIALGLLTYPGIYKNYGIILGVSCFACVIIFTIEMFIKLYVYGRDFFKDGWNNFDFILVAMSWIPTSGPFSSFRAFRVLRALRTLRLVTHLQKLRVIVEAIIEAIPNVVWACTLLLLIFYIFSIMGVTMYSAQFPEYFGTIGTCMFTLFQLTTFEGWPDLARSVMHTHPLAWIYFISFILISSFVVINVIVGVIVNAISEINEKQKRLSEIEEIKNTTNLEQEMFALKEQLCRVENLLSAYRLEDQNK